jgi:hypothetical protein
MNHYGLLAQEHWTRYAPSRLQSLDDPTTYFSQLGETASAQIEDLANRLEQDLPTDLSYLERVGQLRMIRKQAEDVVLGELVFSVTEESTDLTGQLEEALGELPSPAMIDEMLTGMQLQAEEDAEREGWSGPILTDEQEERRIRLERLRPLVTLEQPVEMMTAESVQQRLAALQEYRETLPA